MPWPEVKINKAGQRTTDISVLKLIAMELSSYLALKMKNSKKDAQRTAEDKQKDAQRIAEDFVDDSLKGKKSNWTPVMTLLSPETSSSLCPFPTTRMMWSKSG